jgi:dihydropteroate synthase
VDLGAVVEAARSQLAELLVAAQQAGIPPKAVILDPGLGFGDPPGGDPAANMALLRNCGALSHGRPVLVGASRKRFIGRLTGVEEPARRVAGSVAAAVLAVEAGASIVRVHDVAETVQALKVADAS